MERQYLLGHFGHISKKDTDSMTPFELDNWFDILKKFREEEQKANQPKGD